MVRTEKGRVVYDRKPHKFRYSDVYRILAALGDPYQLNELLRYFVSVGEILSKQVEWQSSRPDGCISVVLESLDTEIQTLRELGANFPGFGGGEFGGGGATIHWPWEGNPFDVEDPNASSK